MVFNISQKKATFTTKIDDVKITNYLMLYHGRKDYNEQDSIQFKNEEDTKAESMKERLKQIRKDFEPEAKILLEAGIESEKIQKVIGRKLEWEAFKFGDE